MARPRKNIDPAKVEALAAIGCPASEIAVAVGCQERTILRRFSSILKSGHEKAKTRIRSKLFRMAMKGNLSACIFLAKAMCGLREEPLFSVNVSTTANTFVVTDEVKKELARMYYTMRRGSSVPQLDKANGHGDGESKVQQ